MIVSHSPIVDNDREGLLAKVLESTQDAIITVNDENNIVIFNQGAEMLFGYTAKEMLGQPARRVLPDCNKDTYECTATLSGETKFTVNGVRKGGSSFPIDATITKIEYEGNVYYTAIVRDFTKRSECVNQISKRSKEIKEYRKNVKRKLLDEITQLAGPRFNYRHPS